MYAPIRTKSHHHKYYATTAGLAMNTQAIPKTSDPKNNTIKLILIDLAYPANTDREIYNTRSCGPL